MLTKLFIVSMFFIALGQSAMAQYYYKDLVVTEQTTGRWKQFRENKVKSVRLSSSENDGSPTEGFAVDQDLSGDYSLISTHTRSKGSTESWMMAYYSSAGRPDRMIDTSDTYRSVSEYQYDDAGRLTVITNTSIETDNHIQAEEKHVWQYGADGKPSAMLKIRNGSDTAYVRFVKDDKGNIGEEHATRNRVELPVVYYYYDADNRLTDIVRYNLKAQRLLPDYVFEYVAGDGSKGSDGGEGGQRLASMLIVPEQGVNEYQKWIYQYNEKGLKTKESCFNKRKDLVGVVGYEYTYR
jgi:YD repeat-containing protein